MEQTNPPIKQKTTFKGYQTSTSIRISPKVNDVINEICKRNALTKSQVISHLITAAVDRKASPFVANLD